MRVAIVGSGSAGIGALWSLRQRSCEVDLFEQSSTAGGHSNSVSITRRGRTQAIDAGFISFNKVTYPAFTKLIDSLNIPLFETDMSIGVSRDSGAFEWAGTGWRGVFAQARNCLSLTFWRMILDIFRFNYFAIDEICAEEDQFESLAQYLERNAYSDAFRNDYLIPIVASTWCTGPDLFAQRCPVQMLVRFMWNHHLLESFTNPIPWFTFPGGSREYVHAVLEKFPPDNLFLNAQVTAVRNTEDGGVALISQDGVRRVYDHVILTASAPQILDMLGNEAEEEERRVLSSFQTLRNECILHSDVSLMPQRRAAWASWNYLTRSESATKEHQDHRSMVTFDMNRLQGISHADFGHVLVTMNPLYSPERSTIRACFTYEHPLYSIEAVKAQSRLPLIQGKRGISYAGAWSRYGFHEDGLASGISAARRFCGGQGVPGVDTSLPYARKAIPRCSFGDHVVRFLLRIVLSATQLFGDEQRMVSSRQVELA